MKADIVIFDPAKIQDKATTPIRTNTPRAFAT